MEIWDSIYPNVGQPAVHTANRTLTQDGLHLVSNVVFSELGASSVIFINGSQTNCMLVYRTTFINPKNADPDINYFCGGAISCKKINCVQVEVCSYGAYSIYSGSHSFVDLGEGSNNRCQVFDCSFTKSTGRNSVLKHLHGVQDIKSTNISYCTGSDQVSTCLYNTVGTTTQNFTMNYNISSTYKNSLFVYIDMTACIFQSVFLKNSNIPGKYGLFSSKRAKTNLKECVIHDNKGEKLFDTSYGDKYTITNCFIENTNCPNNGKKFGPTIDSMHMNLLFFSTQLCEGYEFDFIFIHIQETIAINYAIEKVIIFAEIAFLPILLTKNSPTIFNGSFLSYFFAFLKN